MVQLEQFVAHCSSQIRELLSDSDISDISVDDTMQVCDPSDFEDDLLLGSYGFTSDAMAMLISSEGASFSNTTIRYLLIPKVMHSPILVDAENTAIATDLFFFIEGGRIRPATTIEPLQLDGLIKWGGILNFECPEDYLVHGKALERLSTDKLATKLVFQEYGIKTPVFSEITAQDSRYISEVILEFQQRQGDFAVKGVKGGSGKYVKLCKAGEIAEAVTFARQLLDSGKRAFVEQRKYPLEWRDELGRLIDWNVRSIVTLSDNPHWIEGEARYGLMNGVPKNVSRGADVEELKVVAAKTGISMDQIKADSIEAGKAIYHALKLAGGTPRGVACLDSIVCEDGSYFLENNSSNIRGFGTLMRLRNRRLKSVSEVFLRSLGPFLLENHDRRDGCKEYFPLPYKARDFFEVGSVLSDMEQDEGAIRLFRGAIERKPRYAEGLAGLGIALCHTGNYEEGVEVARRAVDSDPFLREAHLALAIALQLADRPIEAVAYENKAIELGTEKAELYLNLGHCYYNQKDYDRSAEAFKRVVELMPEESGVHFALGASLSAGRHYFKSIPHYLRACRLDKSYRTNVLVNLIFAPLRWVEDAMSQRKQTQTFK